MELICIGDSLTFGMGVRTRQRWTQLVAEEYPCKVTNLGITGDTTGGMLVRLQSKLLNHPLPASRPLVFIMGGCNDIFFSGSDLGARANMGAMIQQLAAAGILPLVGIPTPCVPSAVSPAWKTAVDFEATLPIQDAYCVWLRNFCSAFQAPVVDFRKDFFDPKGHLRQELILDGLHPTAEGHRLMADRMLAVLQQLAQKYGGLG